MKKILKANRKIILQLFGGRGAGSRKSLRNYYLSKMTNKRAWNVVDQLYRPGAKHGDGGTADALKEEIRNNRTIQGKSHYQKAKERMKNIENILDKEKLSEIEKESLNEIYKKLKEAVEEWEQRN